MLCLPWPHGDEPAFRPTSGQQEWLLTTDTQSLYSLGMSVRNRSCSNDIGSDLREQHADRRLRGASRTTVRPHLLPREVQTLARLNSAALRSMTLRPSSRSLWLRLVPIRGHRPKMTKRTSPTMMTAAIATRSRNVFGP
jgi:hypothetical protein